MAPGWPPRLAHFLNALFSIIIIRIGIAAPRKCNLQLLDLLQAEECIYLPTFIGEAASSADKCAVEEAE